MKLRNKKTGEIWQLKANDKGSLYVHSGFEFYDITSIKQLEAFEDYEEPEEVWYIDFQGVVRSASREENDWFKENEIGNCFETKEEAEKAVEKLKAWKRLRDNGFKFKWYDIYQSVIDECETTHIQVTINANKIDVQNDLDLLFGGEE